MRIKYAVSTDEQIPTAIHITHITATTAQIMDKNKKKKDGVTDAASENTPVVVEKGL